MLSTGLNPLQGFGSQGSRSASLGPAACSLASVCKSHVVLIDTFQTSGTMVYFGKQSLAAAACSQITSH